MVLNREEIEKLIKEGKLIENYIDLEKQLTPNGFDLTVNKIFSFKDAGALDFSNKERELSKAQEVRFFRKSSQDKYGWWRLKKGAYKIVTNEVFNLPHNLIALSFPRSSLLRMGAFTQTGVWDAGFKGKSEFILVVENLRGIRIKQNARIVQLIFLRINKVREGYKGIYNLNSKP
ncbi:MAG: deoxyuridine 5'-triphosphate nucleotidohydrolase [Candidatus Omnitrophica bacterium]|nr:deoxyuridine 5'-triphosphate nucleotidohydrolase [Candidatus Omnitrophota bacterium]MCM8793375.1 deoxyuridine 5'-triphosphate nucleotidohydrolase [Candidatus Omnitrophota bacterium]